MKDRTSMQVSQSTLKTVKTLAGMMGKTVDQTVAELAENELVGRGINPETMRALNGK